MQLAAWLDVALEGGVLELERALADYRRLRKLLSGEWKLRARLVAQTADHARASYPDVDAAIDRARRRARTDEAARPGLVLAEHVEKEREALHALLATTRGVRSQFSLQLDWLVEVASEEAHYERSVMHFRQERAAWTVLFASLSIAMPMVSWFIASYGGAVGTIISVEGLEDSAVWLLLGALLGSVLLSWIRLLGWQWLGVKPPRVLGPMVVSVTIAVTGAVALASLAAKNPIPILVNLLLCSGIGVLSMLGAWWRRDHDTSASDIGAAR